MERSVARIESFLGQGSVHRGDTCASRIPSRRNHEVPYLLRKTEESASAQISLQKKPSASAAEAWQGAIPGIGRLHTTALPARLRTDEGRDISVSGEGSLILDTTASALAQEIRPAVLIVGDRSLSVHQWAGPWLIDEYWWDPSRHTRRAYIQIATEKSVHLLYRENGQWFEEGNYA